MYRSSRRQKVLSYCSYPLLVSGEVSFIRNPHCSRQKSSLFRSSARHNRQQKHLANVLVVQTFPRAGGSFYTVLSRRVPLLLNSPPLKMMRFLLQLHWAAISCVSLLPFPSTLFLPLWLFLFPFPLSQHVCDVEWTALKKNSCWTVHSSNTRKRKQPGTPIQLGQ